MVTIVNTGRVDLIFAKMESASDMWDPSEWKFSINNTFFGIESLKKEKKK